MSLPLILYLQPKNIQYFDLQEAALAAPLGINSKKAITGRQEFSLV